MEFKKLTPKDDIEIKVYEEALNFVFDNDDICNVAVSGPYSAGKSSVIESYKKKHKLSLRAESCKAWLTSSLAVLAESSQV